MPARLLAIRRRIEEVDPAVLREAEPAPRIAIERVHPAHYVDLVRDFAARGGGFLNERDMILNAASYDAAQAGAGAVLAATRHACEGRGNAFAAIRPPGHHALAETAMGFCLFANAVIAAREAQQLGRRQVLIVDWDVHHGNGTQALVERDPTIRFVSMHQWPLYPGTGAASERGVGNVFNLPRPPGLLPARYVGDLIAALEQATTGFAPDLLIISAGYDSMWGDPLGGFTLGPDDYVRLTEWLRERCPAAPVVAVLEGGYSPGLLAEGVLATLGALI